MGTEGVSATVVVLVIRASLKVSSDLRFVFSGSSLGFASVTWQTAAQVITHEGHEVSRKFSVSGFPS